MFRRRHNNASSRVAGLDVAAAPVPVSTTEPRGHMTHRPRLPRPVALR